MLFLALQTWKSHKIQLIGCVSISGQFINVVGSQFRLESKNVRMRFYDSLASQPQSVYIE